MVQKQNGLLGTLTSKIGVVKFQTALEIRHLVDILGTYEMPLVSLRKFILAVEDIEERKEAACRWSDHTTALDVIYYTKY